MSNALLVRHRRANQPTIEVTAGSDRWEGRFSPFFRCKRSNRIDAAAPLSRPESAEADGGER
ncbi:hypothetical protein [Halalkalicoccus subterraneus]|uniref:hypothetical protein n=1 Tax=Halalkalicoccus subterraneus TaxID=2675002 RepID=UPI000EFC5F60|nr:hypothetical protein [Halalkalicoccus subterraneus]